MKEVDDYACPPSYFRVTESSMSLRDHFAGVVLQALAQRVQVPEMNAEVGKEIAAMSYTVADAMLKAREP